MLAFVAKHASQGDAAQVSASLIQRVLSYLVLGPPKPSASDSAATSSECEQPHAILRMRGSVLGSR